MAHCANMGETSRLRLALDVFRFFLESVVSVLTLLSVSRPGAHYYVGMFTATVSILESHSQYASLVVNMDLLHAGTIRRSRLHEMYSMWPAIQIS